MAEIYQKAISVDLWCFCATGISVLGGSVLLFISCQVPVRRLSRPVRTCLVFLVAHTHTDTLPTPHLKSNPFLFQLKFYWSEWFDPLTLKSSWCPQRFLPSAVIGVKFPTFLSHFNEVLGKNVKLLISGICLIYIWFKSSILSKSVHSPFMLSFALWSSLSWSFQNPLQLFLRMKMSWDMCSRSGFRCTLSFSPSGRAKKQIQPPLVWAQCDLYVSQTIWLYRSDGTCLHYFLASHSPHETLCWVNNACTTESNILTIQVYFITNRFQINVHLQ